MMPAWRRHLPFAALLAVAAPALVAFTWQPGIASIGDDSVSYLMLARFFASFGADELVAPWVSRHTHFPPLFPLALALVGGHESFLRAHLLVATCGIAALVALYHYARMRLDGVAGATLLVALFVICPTAWISAKAILSEPLFLALTLAALAWHERFLRRGESAACAVAAFAVLLALAVLTRAAGLVLVLAYAMHVLVGALRTRRVPPLSAALPVIVALGATLAWAWLRPRSAQEDLYALTIATVVRLWLDEPVRLLLTSGDSFLSGWVASFTADSAVAPATKGLALGLGLAGVAGAIRAALQNRLDGWYVLVSLGLLLAWVFPEDNMRRLLYPLVPVMLVLAALEVRTVLSCQALARHRRALTLACLTAVLALCLPATLLVGSKAMSREPVLAGSPQRYADITDFYTTLNFARARAVAARHAAVIAGLEAIGSATPAHARVMWVRPEYVAVLGRRQGVPWYHGQRSRALAAAIRRERVDYVAVANLHKTDLARHDADPVTGASLAPYAESALALPNAVTGGDDFVLYQVDRARLDAYLGGG